MNALRGWLVVLLACAYRLARCGVAGFGLAQLSGAPIAALVVLIVAALDLQWLLRLLAALTLWRLLHWPWWGAALVSAPRLVLVLPGLITVVIARLRHPRPRWHAPRPAPPTSGTVGS